MRFSGLKGLTTNYLSKRIIFVQDLFLSLLSVLIDRACRQASSALQDEYFAHSA